MMRLVVLAVLGLSLATPVVAQDTALEQLANARELWQAAQAVNYRFGYQKHCECNRDIPPVTVVTVMGGRIQQVYHLHSDSDRQVPAREGSLDLYWTIDDLLDKLAGALAAEAIVRMEFDSTYGYPKSLYIDYDPDFIGDETDLLLTQFEIL